MRCTPLAVWASTLTKPEDLKAAIIADVEFTHPNPLVHEAVFIYSAAI